MDHMTNLGGEETGRSSRRIVLMAEEIRCGWMERQKNDQERKRQRNVSRQGLQALSGLTGPTTPGGSMSLLIMVPMV